MYQGLSVIAEKRGEKDRHRLLQSEGEWSYGLSREALAKTDRLHCPLGKIQL